MDNLKTLIMNASFLSAEDKLGLVGVSRDTQTQTFFHVNGIISRYDINLFLEYDKNKNKNKNRSINHFDFVVFF